MTPETSSISPTIIIVLVCAAIALLVFLAHSNKGIAEKLGKFGDFADNFKLDKSNITAVPGQAFAPAQPQVIVVPGPAAAAAPTAEQIKEIVRNAIASSPPAPAAPAAAPPKQFSAADMLGRTAETDRAQTLAAAGGDAGAVTDTSGPFELIANGSTKKNLATAHVPLVYYFDVVAEKVGKQHECQWGTNADAVHADVVQTLTGVAVELREVDRHGVAGRRSPPIGWRPSPAYRCARGRYGDGLR